MAKNTKTHLRKAKFLTPQTAACQRTPFLNHILVVEIDRFGLVDCKNCQKTFLYQRLEKMFKWIENTSHWGKVYFPK